MTLDLRFYLSLILRRLPIIVAIIFTATMAGFNTMPCPYLPGLPGRGEAPDRTTESPDELAASTVRSTADEILLAIRQRIMTRDNLLAIAERHNLFVTTPNLSRNEMLDAIGDRVSIYMPTTRGNTGVVTVSFAAGEPELSANITSKDRRPGPAVERGAAHRDFGNTLDFFEQEVRRLTDELSQQNAKILEFEQANRDALPRAGVSAYAAGLAAGAAVAGGSRLAALRDRRERLTSYDPHGRHGHDARRPYPEAELLGRPGQELASGSGRAVTDEPAGQRSAEGSRGAAEVVKSQLSATGGGRLSAFEVQMLDIDGQINFLAEQKTLLEKDLVTLEASIDATPGNSIHLAELQNNYETLRVQYEQAVASLSEARMGDRIEVTDRGQRITVIEKAVPPNFRAEPGRKRITVAAFGAGVITPPACFSSWRS